eukprot:Transcript_11119.p1 GENE.Transcript_11119~~Transcript_11119.p1  ORF type:complete len:327 (-),score=103.51 Transcript_11119:1057-1959(-)
MHLDQPSCRPGAAAAPLSRQALLVAAASSLAGMSVQPALSASSLKAKLDAHDASLLTKPRAMGGPPAEAIYPTWMQGDWQATLRFAGYELPAKDQISREALFAEGTVPGFQKCSIALLPDIGKERVSFPMRWVAEGGSGAVREDRVFNMRSAVRGGLGYDAIERVDYKEDPNNAFGLGSNTGNPNRLKLVFAPGFTPNAERIELFLNGRETEQPSPDLFYLQESVRQVTFSAGQTRQVSGEYCHFWSFRRAADDRVEAVIVTAVYADPLQLERFFVKVGPNRPLILFSHGLSLARDSGVA